MYMAYQVSNPRYVKDNDLVAPFIMTCCGSLTKATLRLASHTPADGNNKVMLIAGTFLKIYTFYTNLVCQS